MTIKLSDDESFVKDIEVKQTTSVKASQVATNIMKAFDQVGADNTVALYLPNKRKSPEVIKYLKAGHDEAKRKISFTGEVEVWF